MRDLNNITQVTALGPDYMGFIFYPPSPRYVGPDFKLFDKANPAIVRVGVFVNASNDEIIKQSRAIGFDHVQLHGNESVQQAGDLKDSGFKVVKVFSVEDDFDFATTRPFAPVVDYFLFDTKGKFYGGNAKTFNWKILNRYDQDVPFFLSGGISPENVNDMSLLDGMNLYALDVNSGVEEAPGLKDLKKLETIFEAVEKLRLKRPAS
ncbi:MAG TPA: phosphoribosylanthranilate isomerase [Chryseolinea sp.]|nr:phosphoribosylanthranilate isomerase [Chryseolinea sp.]